MPVTHGVAGSSPVQTAFYFSFLFLNFPLIHILIRYHPVLWILPDGMRLLYLECLSLRPIKQIAYGESNKDRYRRSIQQDVWLGDVAPIGERVDLSKSETWPTNFRVNYGIYGLFLKDTKCGDIRYGRQYYDYQEGTVVGFAPGQVTGIELKDGTGLWRMGCFSIRTLIRGTALGRDIKRLFFLLL